MARRELDAEGPGGLLGVGPLEVRVAIVAVGEGRGVGEERGGVDVVGDRAGGRGAVAVVVAVVWVKSEGRQDNGLVSDV